MTKILVADDDHEIMEMIRLTLSKEGFDVSVAINGQQAVNQAKKIKPDVVLMDVMMPVMDGMEACRQIKQDADTAGIPVIFLTARNEEFAELAGFDAGADDYISKPVRPRVLLSRLKAILRRNNPTKLQNDAAIIQFPNLIIDRDRYMVEYNGKPIQFPRKEFSLLYFLASKPGRVFTRDEILEHVWGNEVLVVDRTIDVHIRKIREKLDDKFIYTIKGVGYKFEI